MSQYNKTFQAVSTGNEPYYYISAHLDLTGLYTGSIESSNPYIVYFNKENNYNYLDTTLHPNVDEYGGFYPLDDNSVIGEITVFANPDLEYTGVLNTLEFDIGGAYKPSVALDASPVNVSVRQSLDLWGGPTGNTSGPITAFQLENAQVCHYGSEPQEPITSPVYDANWGTRKFLAIKYRIGNVSVETSERSKFKKAKKLVKKIKEKFKKRKMFLLKQSRNFKVVPGQDEFENGKVYVVVKVYPKFQ